MKITILDGYGLNPGDLSWEEFKTLGDINVYPRTSASKVVERSIDSEILLTNKTVLDAKIIASLPKLKYIGVLATGFNVVDIKAATEHGVTVTNIPSYSTMSVAQRVFSLLLAVTDRTEHYAEKNRQGAWSASPDFCWWDTPLTELAGKTMGIIGLGNIGKAVARISTAFDINVLAYTSKPAESLMPGITKSSLDNLFKYSDIISLHCPLTDSTAQIINKDNIEKMKEGVIIINTGRGGLIEEEAVANALDTGKIAAFCADVLSQEPPTPTNPLLSRGNAFITPHIAWATKEARSRLMNIAFVNLKCFLDGAPQNVVN